MTTTEFVLYEVAIFFAGAYCGIAIFEPLWRIITLVWKNAKERQNGNNS